MHCAPSLLSSPLRHATVSAPRAAPPRTAVECPAPWQPFPARRAMPRRTAVGKWGWRKGGVLGEVMVASPMTGQDAHPSHTQAPHMRFKNHQARFGHRLDAQAAHLLAAPAMEGVQEGLLVRAAVCGRQREPVTSLNHRPSITPPTHQRVCTRGNSAPEAASRRVKRLMVLHLATLPDLPSSRCRERAPCTCARAQKKRAMGRQTQDEPASTQ